MYLANFSYSSLLLPLYPCFSMESFNQYNCSFLPDFDLLKQVDLGIKNVTKSSFDSFISSRQSFSRPRPSNFLLINANYGRFEGTNIKTFLHAPYGALPLFRAFQILFDQIRSFFLIHPGTLFGYHPYFSPPLTFFHQCPPSSFDYNLQFI